MADTTKTTSADALGLDAQAEMLKTERRANNVWNKLKRNKTAMIGLVIVVVMVFIAVFAPVLAPYDPDEIHPLDAFLKPFSEGHIFGTDQFGRDLLSRVIYGARVSLIVAAGGTLVGIGNIPSFARVVRGEVHIVKNEEYCNACRVIGVSNTRLLFTHILPNAISPIIVYATLNVASAIISEAALSFLGLGIAAPTASWGSILREGKSSLTTAPFVATISGAFILITVLGFNLFGDGIRDVLDPKMKQ